MIKKCLLLVVCCYVSILAHAQSLGYFNDSNYLKIFSYLKISTDQLNSGLLKQLREIRNNDNFLDSIQIINLGSTGLPNEIIAFKVLIQYANEAKPFEYYFCFNKDKRQLYQLKGFYNNDFVQFFDYLKTKRYRISKAYFKKKSIEIEKVNLDCLINLYESKRNKLLTDIDRATYDCLKYNMQPVIIN